MAKEQAVPPDHCVNISAVSPEFIFKIFTYRGKLSVFTNDQMWVFAYVYAHIDKEKRKRKKDTATKITWHFLHMRTEISVLKGKKKLEQETPFYGIVPLSSLI